MGQLSFTEALRMRVFMNWQIVGLPGTAVILLSVLLLPAAASAAEECGSLDRLITAARLVRAVYPELKGKEASVAFSEGTGGPVSGPIDARFLSIKVDKPLFHTPEKHSEPEEMAPSPTAIRGKLELPQYLSIDFMVWGSSPHIVCRPVHLLNNTTSPMLEAARAEINSHPSWTDADALEAAKRHGLRYGPNDKQALLELIPLRELGTFFGTLRVKRTKFTVTSEHKKDATHSFASLSWVITAEEVGTTRALEISVEPFQGAIVGLSEGDKQDLLH
jgi:hypothetical protein